MGKIYVITDGEYSDYHVVAATTDKKKAEKIRREITDYRFGCSARIEIYEDGEIGEEVYGVALVSKDGLIKDYWETDVDGQPPVADYGCGYLVVVPVGDDVELIEKIARDKIAEYKYHKVEEGI